MAAGAKKQSPQGDGDFARARVFLTQNILPPLERAAQADPSDAAAHAELAHWYEQRWVFSRNEEDRKLSLGGSQPSHSARPRREGRLRGPLPAHMLSAQQPVPNARDFYRASGGRPGPGRERDPTPAPLRYRLAEVYFQAGDAVDGRRQAREALDLDALSTEPSRQLKRCPAQTGRAVDRNQEARSSRQAWPCAGCHAFGANPRPAWQTKPASARKHG